MYIYIIKISLDEKYNITANINKHPLVFLPMKKIIFPEEYIKIFLAEENLEQITKEHQLIYNGLKVEITSFSQKNLVQNFEKIKQFFEPHKDAHLLYYCKNYYKIGNIFNRFSDILKYCHRDKNIDDEEKINKYSIYSPLKNIISQIESKKTIYNNIININKHYNPCYKLFEDFFLTKDYQLLKNLYKKSDLELVEDLESGKEEEEDILFLLEKLKQINNTKWYKNICLLENIIKEEENNNFNITSFSDLNTTILTFKNESSSLLTYSEFSLNENNDEPNFDLVIIFKELFSNQKRLEYDPVKIKLLEKGYFSEFEILSEFMIPKNEKTISYLKEQMERLEKDSNNIEDIQKILINFNECMENNYNFIDDKLKYQEYNEREFISHSDQKALINIRRKRVLKNYLSKYTGYKEKVNISVSHIFNHFIQFLTIYYPGYNNYFHHRNFSLLLKDLGYKSQRKNDGSFILNLEIKNNFFN